MNFFEGDKLAGLTISAFENLNGLTLAVVFINAIVRF